MLGPMGERSNILEEFGGAIRERRAELGLTQEKLAEIADLHRNYVGGVERGERNASLFNMVKIAEALEMELHELVERAGL